MLKIWNYEISTQFLGTALRILILIAIGIPFLRIISSFLSKFFKNRFSAQSQMIVQKSIYYAGFSLLFIMVLNQLGVKLSALLGAAGIVGIALGFASQTSVSNIISGIFLIWEEPFRVGDVIEIGDTKGTIVSIDLLSIKLRTFNNWFIRIPNENIIKTQVTNITNYPIRRLDIDIGVAYKEDINKVLDILKEIAENNPLCLDEPDPFIMFNEFGSSSLNIKFGVWVLNENYFKLKKELMIEIKERFDRENIEIPFPHMTLYTGSVTDPFPIKMENNKN